MTLALCHGPSLVANQNEITLLSDLILKANPNTSIIYLDRLGNERLETYGSLLNEARRILQGLRDLGLQPKDKLIFQLENNEDILPTFWACQLGGFEPAIVPVPVTYDTDNKPLDQVQDLWNLFDQAMICTTAALSANLKASIAVPAFSNAKIATIESLRQSSPANTSFRAQPSDTALYSLSSGSTGRSKAIALTHTNLLSRGKGSNILCHNQANDIIFSWLPFDHIGNISAYHISPILMGSQLVYAPKELILAKPLRWLDLIDRYRISHCWAPNFAFALVSKNIKDGEKYSWDLSSIKGLLSAGEVISRSTIQEFVHKLEPYGLEKSCVISAFGMAEVCSGVTYHLPAKDSSIEFHHLDRQHLSGAIKLTTEDDHNSVSFANLGPVIPGVSMRIADETGKVVEENVIGLFQLKGAPLSPGYYKNPEANKAFLDDGWFNTGDAGFISNGQLSLIGRSELGIIVNGVNLSNTEIETLVEQVPGITPSFTAACGVLGPNNQGQKLAIFFNPTQALDEIEFQKLSKLIQGQLIKYIGIKADYLIPLEANSIPKTPIGKIQHKKLVQQFNSSAFDHIISSQEAQLNKQNAAKKALSSLHHHSEIENQIISIWKEVLELDEVGLEDNFFELGGHSLLLVQIHEQLTPIYPTLSFVDLFKYPTIASLVLGMSDLVTSDSPSMKGQEKAEARRNHQIKDSHDIAVIGMACRFPGANDIETFWNNLITGTESISQFTAKQVIDGGISAELATHQNYIKASPTLANIKGFDAEFFGYSTKEAELMDPQHRLFLECCWEVFEDAGYDPLTIKKTVGIYAGAAMNTYLMNNVLPNRHTLDPNDDLNITTLDSMGGFQLMVANDKDYISTRVSYKLNLTGPSVNIQTACSTGIVSIHMACQSLLAGEADLFIAGGSSIQVPEHSGHLYQAGLIVSDDTHVRSFDAKAKGTIFGSGAGAVLLKPLSRAIEDGDHIYAVIKGSAVNNDGGVKVGYMAPSSEGQATVIAEAIHIAGVPANSIGLVEAHGTGTEMGDPIEFNGLTQVFRSQTEETGFCALGSVKTNVGHLQITSGTVGFIKTALALEHKLIPPMLNFEEINPGIDLESSPFYINTSPTEWKVKNFPRRAGVSSLGIGGTNAHLILEEAPERILERSETDRPQHILFLSTRNKSALNEQVAQYIQFLRKNPQIDLRDIAFTANTGRHAFNSRLAVYGPNSAEIAQSLENWQQSGSDPQVRQAELISNQKKRTAFLFTGQGSQYPNMGLELYQTQAVFRETIDYCAQILDPLLPKGLLEIMYSQEQNSELIHQTQFSQPALFALEIALAKLWKSWGISPSYVIGHSLGEVAAACFAGVFTLEDGLQLVAKRAQLMQAQDTNGEMWSIQSTAESVKQYLLPFADQIAIAAINGPQSLVISGEKSAVSEVISKLNTDGFKTQRLITSHAFHSPLMKGAIEPFKVFLDGIAMHQPSIPLVSNLSGDIAGPEIASPQYWCDQILSPVLFMQDIQTLEGLGCNELIEIGPKPVLLGLASQVLNSEISLLPSLMPEKSNWSVMLDSLATLAVSQNIDWISFDQPFKRYRFALPTYPFQHLPYWIDRPKGIANKTLTKNDGRLLGGKLPLPSVSSNIYQSVLNSDELSLLNDHQIYNELVVSGAYHVVMMLDGALSQNRFGEFSLENIYFPEPLVLERSKNKYVQLIITPNADNNSALLISFDEPNPGSSTNLKVSTHAEAQIRAVVHNMVKKSYSEIRKRCHTALSVVQFIQNQADRQITLGPSYQWFNAIYKGEDEVVCDIRTPDSLGGLHPEQLHPGLIDAAFGMLLASGTLDPQKTWLPFTIESICVYANPNNRKIWGHLTIRKSANAENIIADISLVDSEDGSVLIEFKGLEARSAELSAIQKYLPNPSKNLMWERHWNEISLPNSEFKNTGKPYLVFKDDQGFSEQLVQVLTAAQQTVYLVSPGEQFSKDDHSQYTINPNSKKDLHQLVEEIQSKEGGLGAVVNFWPINQLLTNKATLISEIEIHCQFLLHLTQVLVGSAISTDFRLCNITLGAQVAQEEPGDINLAYAPLLGMSLSIAAEHPELNIVCIDLDVASDSKQLTSVAVQAITQKHDQAWLALRDEKLLTPHLSSMNEVQIDGSIYPNANATYLIAGGSKGIGLKAAQWFASQGAKHLAILSRNKPSGTNQALIDELEAAGVNIKTWQVDVSDKTALQTTFLEIEQIMPPLKGVIHCSGILADKLLPDFDWQQFSKTFDAKVEGAWNLHELTKNISLDFFVLFSSAASLVGNQGQANYSAANAFLDYLAQFRHAAGLPATSINWGPWADIGMLQSDPVAKVHLARLGFTPILPDQGFAAMMVAINSGKPQVGIIDWDWQTYLDQSPWIASLFTKLANQQLNKNVIQQSSTSVIENFAKLSKADQTLQIVLWVEESVRSTLGVAKEQKLEHDKSLTDLGLDSLLAVQLRNHLGKTIQLTLPVSLAFNYPTIADMIRFITDLLENALPKANLEPDSHLKPNESPNSASQSAQDLLADLEKLLN